MVSITPAPPRAKRTVETMLTERNLKQTPVPKEYDIYEEAEELFKLFVIWIYPNAYDEAFSWTQDFLDTLGWKNMKTKEIFKMSRRSVEWSSTVQKEQQRMATAEGLMRNISEMSKATVSMLQEQQRLKEFISYYGDKDKDIPEKELNLKGIWVDYVDAPKPASIAQLERNYEYIMLRDLIYACKTSEDVEKVEYANERVKAIATRKITEYLEWKKNWKENIDKAKSIIDERIVSFENTINMYKDWVKPMLRDVQFFRMSGIGDDFEKEEWLDPSFVEMGNWMGAKSKLAFWKGIAKDGINAVFSEKQVSDLKFDGKPVKLGEVKELIKLVNKSKTEPPKNEEEGKKLEEATDSLKIIEDVFASKCESRYWVPVIEFTFSKFAPAAPANIQEGGTAMGAKVSVYPAKVFLARYADWIKDPADEWIKSVLEPIEKAKASNKKEAPKELSVFEAFGESFKGFDSAIKSITKGIRSLSSLFSEKPSIKSYDSRRKRDKAIAEVMDHIQNYYDKFKKAHGMLTWDDRTFKSEGVLPAKVIIKK